MKAELSVAVDESGRSPDESGPHAVAERTLGHGRELATRLVDAIREVIIGQDETVEAVVMALLAGGHVLLEGAPGLGKTHLVRTLARLVGGHFSRIQFTPDLMPSDVVGTSLVVTTAAGGKDLSYRPGPIFANLVLADEINRATPKTQSALLEAMAERTVTVDGTPRPLPAPFFVLATENPIEMEGVFPLPEAQLDRFLVKLVLAMPDLEALTAIGARPAEPSPPDAITSPSEILEVQALARELPAAAHVERHAARLTLATHAPAEVRYGAGPRAALSLMACARVRAMMAGRAAVAIDDLTEVAPAVLRHRVVLNFSADAQGLSADDVVRRVVDATEVEE